MSLENLNQPEKHEGKKLSFEEKMLPYQLTYAAKLWNKEIPTPEDMPLPDTFEEALNMYSDIGTAIFDAYENHVGDMSEVESQFYDDFENKILSKVHEAYNQSPEKWIEHIPAIIKAAIEQVPKDYKEIPPNVYDRYREVGAIRYHSIDNRENFTEFGINKGDELIDIHLDTRDDGKNIFLEESMKLLAKDIIAYHPNAKGVIIESWLVDSPIMQRVGFTSIEPRNRGFIRGSTFWGQFVDKDGNVKEDAMKRFLVTGKPPYEIKSGIILIKQFLEKYGPQEKNPQ